jgi:hypothetical protein
MQVATIGLDLAKHVFQIHRIDAAEKVVVRKQLRRSQVMAFLGFMTCPSLLLRASTSYRVGDDVTCTMVAKDQKTNVGLFQSAIPADGTLAARSHARISASPASRAATQNLADFTGTLYPPIGGLARCRVSMVEVRLGVILPPRALQPPKKISGASLGNFEINSRVAYHLQIPELFMLVVTSGLRIKAQCPPNARI